MTYRLLFSEAKGIASFNSMMAASTSPPCSSRLLRLIRASTCRGLSRNTSKNCSKAAPYCSVPWRAHKTPKAKRASVKSGLSPIAVLNASSASGILPFSRRASPNLYLAMAASPFASTPLSGAEEGRLLELVSGVRKNHRHKKGRTSAPSQIFFISKRRFRRTILG